MLLMEQGYVSDSENTFFMQLNNSEWGILSFQPVDYSENGIECCAQIYLDEFKELMNNFVVFDTKNA